MRLFERVCEYALPIYTYAYNVRVKSLILMDKRLEEPYRHLAPVYFTVLLSRSIVSGNERHFICINPKQSPMWLVAFLLVKITCHGRYERK